MTYLEQVEVEPAVVLDVVSHTGQQILQKDKSLVKFGVFGLHIPNFIKSIFKNNQFDLTNPCLVVEALRHVGLEPRGEDLCCPEDCGGGPLVGLRDAEQLLPVPVLRDHLEELGNLPAPGKKVK